MLWRRRYQMSVDLGGLDTGMAEKLLQTNKRCRRMHVGGKGMAHTCGDTRSGLANPAATAATLISFRAAWRVSAFVPLRTE